MRIHIYDNAEQIAKAAGDMLIEAVNTSENPVIGFATGATPVPTYKYLVKNYEDGNVSFKKMTTFNLDEYCDLPVEDKNSYYSFMHDNLFDHIDVLEENVNFLNGNAEDAEKECKRYDDLMEETSIDIQILGIGRNGHIGFNEPSDKFSKGSFKVQLTDSTIEANSIYFDENPMPHYALTMGTVPILHSKKIILIATGEAKADAVYETINGEITPNCPASILQVHPDVHIFLDKEAASRL